MINLKKYIFCTETYKALQWPSVDHRWNVLVPADYSSSHKSVLRYGPLFMGLEEASMDYKCIDVTSLRAMSPFAAISVNEWCGISDSAMQNHPNSNNDRSQQGEGPPDLLVGGCRLWLCFMLQCVTWSMVQKMNLSFIGNTRLFVKVFT